LELDTEQLSMMFFNCAPEETGHIFKVFPSKDVTERAAVACTRSLRDDIEDDLCITVLLTAEEEGSVYEEILTSTLQRLLKSKGDPVKNQRRYRQILSDSYRKIERRGGSRDRSLCPYMYERPIRDDEITSFCRVVKKQCYLTIYEMPGYPQCPRYIRRQRQIQLANARQLVRAGIQRILEDHDQQRQDAKHPFIQFLIAFLLFSACQKKPKISPIISSNTSGKKGSSRGILAPSLLLLLPIMLQNRLATLYPKMI
jgi:hypothetical protein